MIWKIVAGSSILLGLLLGVGGVVWTTATTFASKQDLEATKSVIIEDMTDLAGDVRSNRLLILNDRLAQAEAEARTYIRNGQPVPPGLLDWIRQIKQAIEQEKRR